ncbi:hypothetical protein Acr_25g0006400 [Actinidia rufa]|uniref:Uncharacterized protein n=1 Tax=Actinidia rufa TaxID=165716 RepID=A0A7J0GZM7_9ERIC|nr:hypothetical protein Acr_25g0006400 [Actinidia rufa]
MNSPTNDYDQMLQESIAHFLANYRKGCTDFSVFGSIFFRLVHKMTDPPLEIAWFSSAVTFHSSVKSILEDPLKKSVVLAVKDLFQLLVSLSGPCNGLKRVALLAPVVERLRGSWKGLLATLAYAARTIHVIGKNGSGNLAGAFVDLTRVWTVDRVGEGCEFGDNLRVFFPLVSGEICNGVCVDCGVGYLAGVVMVEAFLLRLYLKFGSTGLREDLQKDMQNWAVQTIKAFQNPHFFDMLLKMLLEPSLPVTNLLNSRDEVLLREVMYDVAILVDYSFLKPEIWTRVPGDHFKKFSLTWLLVADKAAFQFIRDCCDHTRAISYIDVFSKSGVPYQLIKWVTDQTGLEENIIRPNVSTPKALIRWLLALENRGIRVFDHNVSSLHAKAVICKSKIDHVHLGSQIRIAETQMVASYLVLIKLMMTKRWLTGCTIRCICSVGEMCLPRRDDTLNGGNEVRIQSMV